MADEKLNSLAVNIEARTAGIEKAMNRLEKQLRGNLGRVQAAAKKDIGGLEKALSSADRRMVDFGKGFGRQILPAFAAIGAALGTRELINLTDTWTDLTSRVNLAAGSMDKGADVMGRLGEMARRTYSSLEQTTESYLANSTALRELGYNTDEQLNYTEALNNALVISAAKGQRAEAVQNALAKAMAGGKLAGQDLNTVITQGGRVAEALAQGLGVGVNQLRALGAEGKITSREVFRALTSQMERLRKEAESMPATISDGVQLLKNALLEYVGNADQATGVSARISEALVVMADNFDKTADVGLQLAGIIAGALVGRSLIGMIRTLGLGSRALISFTRALTAARTMGGLAAAFGGIGAAAGPAGLVVGGALVAALTLFSSTSAQAGEGAKRFADRLKAIEDSAEEAAVKVEEAGNRFNEAMKNALGNEVAAAADELDNAHAAAVRLFTEIIDNAPRRLVSDEQLKSLENLRDELQKDAEKAEETKNELYRLANANPDFQQLADQLQPLLDRLNLVIQGVRQAKAELDAVSRSPVTEAYQEYGRSRIAGNAIEEERNAYEREALRRASLGRDQLALETEIARVRNDSLKEGIQLTEEQIKRIAEANLAGNAARSSSRGGGRSRSADRADEYDRLAERISAATAALVTETEVQRQLNPLIDDYGYAATKARTAQELLNASQKAGIPFTQELVDQIDELAHNYAIATVEAAKLAETQDEVRQKAEEMAAFQKDLARGIIDGFVQGKKAADIFADALKKIADRLLEMALNSMFNPMGGGGDFHGTIFTLEF